MCKQYRIVSSCSCFHKNYKNTPIQENFYSVANSMKGKKGNTNIPHSFSNIMCVFYPFAIIKGKAKADARTKEMGFSLKLVWHSVV